MRGDLVTAFKGVSRPSPVFSHRFFARPFRNNEPSLLPSWPRSLDSNLDRPQSAQFNSGHCPHRSRDIRKPLFGFGIPYHHVSGLRLLDQLIGHDAMLMLPGILFHHFPHQGRDVGRQPVEPVPCLVAPQEPIHPRSGLPGRNIDPDDPATGATLGSDEPSERITGDAFFNPSVCIQLPQPQVNITSFNLETGALFVQRPGFRAARRCLTVRTVANQSFRGTGCRAWHR